MLIEWSKELDRQAAEQATLIWGGMIDKGGHYFWEIYDPTDAYKSPFNSHLIVTAMPGAALLPGFYSIRRMAKG